ncbi:MAG: hypothetical protein IV097_23840 [Burkholderiaceae bacterium]|nr:hypothetical protein [Burkholderiaceae bacterium]
MLPVAHAEADDIGQDADVGDLMHGSSRTVAMKRLADEREGRVLFTHGQFVEASFVSGLLSSLRRLAAA